MNEWLLIFRSLISHSSLSLHFLLYAASAVLPAHGLFFSPIFFLDQNELRSHQFHKALFHWSNNSSFIVRAREREMRYWVAARIPLSAQAARGRDGVQVKTRSKTNVYMDFAVSSLYFSSVVSSNEWSRQ